MRSGRTVANWRHNSEPMDPPAPVTITVRPCTNDRTPPVSVSMGARCNRSSMRTSRSREATSVRVMSSCSEGTVRVSSPALRASCNTCRMTLPGADGMAMITCRTPKAWAACGNSEMLPTTGRSPTTRPRLRGSSSRKPIGRKPNRFCESNSRAAIWPAVPAPTMSAVGNRRSICRRSRRRRTKRAATRGSVIAAPAKSASIMVTDSGIRPLVQPILVSRNVPTRTENSPPNTAAPAISSSSATLASDQTRLYSPSIQ